MWRWAARSQGSSVGPMSGRPWSCARAWCWRSKRSRALMRACAAPVSWHPRARAVKRCKPGQDLRFDLPAAGPVTLEVMREAGAKVLAVEAGKTVAPTPTCSSSGRPGSASRWLGTETLPKAGLPSSRAAPTVAGMRALIGSGLVATILAFVAACAPVEAARDGGAVVGGGPGGGEGGGAPGRRRTGRRRRAGGRGQADGGQADGGQVHGGQADGGQVDAGKPTEDRSTLDSRSMLVSRDWGVTR